MMIPRYDDTANWMWIPDTQRYPSTFGFRCSCRSAVTRLLHLLLGTCLMCQGRLTAFEGGGEKKCLERQNMEIFPKV